MPVLSLCPKVGANTGPIACDVNRGMPQVMIIGGKTFAPADYATSDTFQAAFLEAITLGNSDSNKLYPFPEIVNVVNNTEADTTGTTGTGVVLKLRDGRPAYTFGVLVGSNLEKQLRKFDGATVPVFIFDDKSNVWGSVDAAGNFKGNRARIGVTGKPFDDGNSIDTAYTTVTVSFISLKQFVDFAAFVNTDFDASELEGLYDIAILEAAAHASNVYKLSPEYVNSQLGANLKMYDQYEDELAVAALWKAFSGASLTTPLAITSVAKDTALGAYTVTLDTTAYAALPALSKIKITLDEPPALKAGGVIGIEAVPLIVTK